MTIVFIKDPLEATRTTRLGWDSHRPVPSAVRSAGMRKWRYVLTF